MKRYSFVIGKSYSFVIGKNGAIKELSPRAKSYIHGIGRGLDPLPVVKRGSFYESDSRALTSDFEALGDDLAVVLSQDGKGRKVTKRVA